MRIPRHHFLAPALFVVTAALAACGGDNEDVPQGEGEGERQSPKLAIDERKGTVEGVGIGDPVVRIERVFGEAPEGVRPPGAATPHDVDPTEVTGPRTGGCEGRGSVFTLRYRGVSFAGLGERTCAVRATNERAKLRRGLSPGDPIKRAEELYPELECGETNVGADEPVFEAVCFGQLLSAGRESTHLWIGGDPINLVLMSNAPNAPELRE